MKRDLKLWDCVGRAYGSVLANPDGFFRQNWAWMVASFVASALGVGIRDLRTLQIVGLAQILLSITISVGVAVGWHRLVLLRESRSGLRTLRFGRREVRFLGWAVFFLVVGTLAFLPLLAVMLVHRTPLLAVIAAVIGVVAFVAVYWFIVRCCLVFPIIAQDHKRAFARAWQLGKGHALGLLALLLASTPFPIAVSLLMRWAGPLIQHGEYLSAVVLDIAVIMLGTMGVCVAAAAVSCAFQNLIESKEPR